MNFMDKLKRKNDNIEEEFVPLVPQQNNQIPMGNNVPSFNLQNDIMAQNGQQSPMGNPNMGGQPMAPNMGQQPQMGQPNMGGQPMNPNMGQQPQMGQPNMGGQPMAPNMGQQPQMGQPNMGGQPMAPNMGQQPPMGNPNMGGQPMAPNMGQQPQMGQPNMGGQPMAPNMGQQPQMGNPNMGGQQMAPNMGGQSMDPNMGQQPQMGNPNMGYGNPNMGMPQQNEQIGGQMFNNNKQNPLVKQKPQMNNNNFDQNNNNMPNVKFIQNNSNKVIEPEYYGPLRPFFEKSTISSIHMYGHNLISYQVNGEDILGQSPWNSEDDFTNFLEGLINWNEKNPHPVSLKEFREKRKTFGTYYMKDLSRLHIAVTEDEIYATIAVKRKDSLSLDDLAKMGMFDDSVKTFIYDAILANGKIILAGQGGAGKTTFIQACGNVINPRNVTLVAEEYREISLNKANVKYVNANDDRPLSMVVRESTKMRIRNLIVGEVIGEEALAMLEAMNTGLDVVLATTHANSAYQALNRLITLATKTSPNINTKFVKHLIGDNVDMIIFLEEINGKKTLSEIIALERYQEEVDKIIANHVYNLKKGVTTIQKATTSRIMKKIDEHKKSLNQRQ
jgi:Flp pilus assembly CpaF family ATPase